MARQSTGRFGFTVFAMVIGAGLLVAAISSGLFDSDRPSRQAREFSEQLETLKKDSISANKVSAPTLGQALGVDDAELVEMGGIQRPKRDVAFLDRTGESEKSDPGQANADSVSPAARSPFPHPGHAPAAELDSHPQVAQLFEELQSPEKLQSPDERRSARSAWFAPEAFDRQTYEADRESWLNQIRPGRVYQTAQPGPDITPIRSGSPMFQHVLQGERVILEVKAEPGAPVTFYTPQVGEFPNRLTTHSVAANEEGIARTTWLAGPGTQGIIDILAASPIHSGQLAFKVHVSLPD